MKPRGSADLEKKVTLKYLGKREREIMAAGCRLHKLLYYTKMRRVVSFGQVWGEQ